MEDAGGMSYEFHCITRDKIKDLVKDLIKKLIL